MKRDKNAQFANLPPVAGEYIRLVIKKMGYRRKVREEVQAELIAHFEDALQDLATDFTGYTENKRRESATENTEEKINHGFTRINTDVNKSEALIPKSETNSNNEIQNSKQTAKKINHELTRINTDDEKRKIDERVQKIIEEFGDAKLLGILARRAKKRCRSWWRTAVVRGFQAVGIFILYVVICSIPLFIGRPTIRTSYLDLLNATIERGGDPCENAQLYYDKAAAILPEDTYGISSLRKNWPGDFNDTERANLVKWLADSKPALDLLRQGVQKPLCWSVYDTNLTEEQIKKIDEQKAMQKQFNKPSLSQKVLAKCGRSNSKQEAILSNMMESLGKLRQLARRMMYQILYEAHIGDVNAAVADCVALHIFAEQRVGRGKLVEQLVGIAIDAMAIANAFEIMDRTDLSPQLLFDLQKEFEKSLVLQRPVVNFDGEKSAYLDLVQHCFTDDGKGDGRMLWQGLAFMASIKGSFLTKYFTMQFPSRKEALADIEALYKKVDCRLRQTPWQIDKEDTIGYKDNNIILLDILTPAYDKVGQISWRLNCHCKAVITTAAVLRYKKEKGAYPETLEQLVAAGYLKALPMDPYSDKPLVYRKTDNNFLLYTPGPSLVDHGGKMTKMWAEDGDTIFWPVEKPKAAKIAQRPSPGMPGMGQGK